MLSKQILVSKILLGAVMSVLACAALVSVTEAQNNAGQVGIQASDDACRTQKGTPQYSSNGEWSGWAMDTNKYDPDCFRVYLSSGKGLLNNDVQVCVQMADDAGKSQRGNEKCTPWSSKGGGWSEWATDKNAYDPDAARILIRTRPLDEGVVVEDIRLGIQVSDDACKKQVGEVKYTPWSSEGAGWSGWATDKNAYDPDCVRLSLKSKVTEQVDVCPNIQGIQTVVPAGNILQGNDCVPASCPVGQTLQGSVCAPISCPAGQTLQGSICVSANCPAGQSMVNGACQPNSCVAGPYCVGDDVYYQAATCTNAFTQNCEHGCQNGRCLAEPECPSFTVAKRVVRYGEETLVLWCGGDEVLSCIVEGTNGDRWEGNLNSATTSPIISETEYRLMCDDDEIDTIMVRPLPQTQET